MQTRKAARVLPEPVGAAISVSRPAAISAQPPSCGSVGPSGNRRSNQVRTAGWKVSITEPLYRRVPTRAWPLVNGVAYPTEELAPVRSVGFAALVLLVSVPSVMVLPVVGLAVVGLAAVVLAV